MLECGVHTQRIPLHIVGTDVAVSMPLLFTALVKLQFLQRPFCPKSVPQSILPNPTNNKRLSVAPMSCRILIDIVGTYIQVERVQLSVYSIS